MKPLRRPVEAGNVVSELGDSMRKAREETLCSSLTYDARLTMPNVADMLCATF
jgi:hypothetical protein